MIILVISLVIIFFALYEPKFNDDMPPMLSAKYSSKSWSITGHTFEICGKVVSLDDFTEKGWFEQRFASNAELRMSEFENVYHGFNSKYNPIHVQNLHFFEKESNGCTMRAAVHPITKETYIYISM